MKSDWYKSKDVQQRKPKLAWGEMQSALDDIIKEEQITSLPAPSQKPEAP